MFYSCRCFTVVTLLLALIFMPGCGRKTPLVPPQKLVPAAIGDLHYNLDENGVTLQWSYPLRMENGDALTAIESFEVFRAEIPEADYCGDCPVRFDRPVQIGGGPLPPTGEGRTAEYKERELRPGYRYLYKIRSRGDWWYPSGDSNSVSFVWSLPPGVPEGLQAAAGDRSIKLSWQPVQNNVAGAPLGRVPVYQVYRKSGNAGFAPLGKPVAGLEFIDTGLGNGILYTYRLRALVTNGETLQAGGASSEVSGVPRDMQPPARPENLVAVETAAGIKLVWQAVLDNDLAGYRIYRRKADSAEPLLIAEVGPDQNHYVDADSIGGRNWFYSVTSFDTMQPPNESLPSAESAVELR